MAINATHHFVVVSNRFWARHRLRFLTLERQAVAPVTKMWTDRLSSQLNAITDGTSTDLESWNEPRVAFLGLVLRLSITSLHNPVRFVSGSTHSADRVQTNPE